MVQRDTGFETCNIAVTNSVLAVTGNLTLDRYLEHNPKPRVLLIQLSPDGFQPESYLWKQTVYTEGLVELLRHGSPADQSAGALQASAGIIRLCGLRCRDSRLTRC